MKKVLSNNKGLTLLELLIGIAISCIVIVSAYSFVLVGSKQYDSTTKNTEIQTEVQFISGIVSDAIVAGKYNSAAIYESTSYIQLNTGNKILYYDKDNGKLALYEASETPGTGIDDHLVSDKVDSFEVSFGVTGKETTTAPTTTAVATTGATPTTVTPATTTSSLPAGTSVKYATSNLVNVKFVVKMKNKTVTYQDEYKIRCAK